MEEDNKPRKHKAVKLRPDLLPNEEAEAEPFKLDDSAIVPVRIIKDHGPTLLVEWTVDDNDRRRAYLPKEVIQHLRPDGIGSIGEIEQAELDAGAPYGVAWERYAPIAEVASEVGREMRRRNIWTVRDLQGRANEAQAAYLGACKWHALLQAVRNLEDK